MQGEYTCFNHHSPHTWRCRWFAEWNAGTGFRTLRFTVTLSPSTRSLAGWKPTVMWVIVCGSGGSNLRIPQKSATHK